jgi:preprotein translocase subunit SecD
MMIRILRFNSYLALALMFALAAGCKSTKPRKLKEASLRLHLEVNPDGSDRNEPIPVGRQQPFQVNVEKRAFLTEFNIERASVVDTMGGYSITVQFDKEGTWLLEQYTTANRGKRVAIAAEFGEMRWLAAPVMNQRIANGLLVFTPDTSREEAERLVGGLNNFAVKVRKGRR